MGGQMINKKVKQKWWGSSSRMLSYGEAGRKFKKSSKSDTLTLIALIENIEVNVPTGPCAYKILVEFH